MKKLLPLIALLISFQHFSVAQDNRTIDSLLSILKRLNTVDNNNSLKDSSKAKILYELSTSYWGNQLDTSLYYANQTLLVSEKIGYKIGVADAYNSMGVVAWYKGEYEASIEFHKKSLLISEEIGNKLRIIKSYNNLGLDYEDQGNFPEALNCYFKSLSVSEATNNKHQVALQSNNIGTVYYAHKNYTEALNYFQKALKIRLETKDKLGLSESYSNIGMIYDDLNNIPAAIENYNNALKIRIELGEQADIAISYNNFGSLYTKMHRYDDALNSYQKALELNKQFGLKERIANVYTNIAGLFELQGKLPEAISNATNALEVSKEIGSVDNLKNDYDLLTRLSAKTNNYKDAYTYSVLFKQMNDSLFNAEKVKALTKVQMNYEFDKKEALSKAESRKQKLIIIFVVLGLLIVLVFAGFVFRLLRARNKQNKIIIEQKHIVEAKQKEILGSIEYALRIQTAILPPQKMVKQYLENSFILYKPKDIVAGDFYWMERVNDLILFAACDCTGHGVPGAMVSVVCHNALNRAVREFGVTQPASILDKTAEIVIENFSASEEDIKDGMDISLCAYDPKTKTMHWAGANCPLWLVQNNELIETKADKQPIGMNEGSKPFTNHTFTLNAADTIYLFTDGFADQFGGETGQKKLTRKRFKDLIISIQNKSLQEQGITLDKFITDYRKEIEQIDDILVMGVRV